MEDVKWLLKKYGSLIALMVIIVITGSIVLGKRSSERNAEEVWEPPIEILSDNTSVPSGGNKEVSGNTAAGEGEEESETDVVRQIKRGCFRQIKTVRQEASGKHPVTLLSVYLAHWKKQQATHAD